LRIETLRVSVTHCRKCPRLVRHRERTAKQKKRQFMDWTYWGRPVPSFGDPHARLLLIGLAPAAHGGNRTGRIFTGDRSGDWLFRALYKSGFSNQATSTHRGDGLKLNNCYVTAVIHCAPPENKPTRQEIINCQPFLLEELNLLKRLRVVVALGRIAFDNYLNAYRKLGGSPRSPRPSFGHGKVYRMDPQITLIASYHPSQQNTLTGRLTQPMFQSIFAKARRSLKD
jgi:uracil-DNA glycosylase